MEEGEQEPVEEEEDVKEEEATEGEVSPKEEQEADQDWPVSLVGFRRYQIDRGASLGGETLVDLPHAGSLFPSQRP